jgi:hypothetical protein
MILSGGGDMGVRVYYNGWQELGAVRYEIEWITVKPSVMDKQEIDPDLDTIANVEFRLTKDEAMRRGQEIFDAATAEPINLCWGVVSVRKQVVGYDDYDEERIIADWQDGGDSEEILSETDYAEWIAEQGAVHA